MSAQAEQLDESLEHVLSGNTIQYLTFGLGEEIYGVDILRVHEIRGWDSVTRIPNSPDHVKGVINIRGLIIPVVDLRMRFDLSEAVYTPTTVVIVMAVQTKTGERMVGIVVDTVSDVADVTQDKIRSAPEFGTHLDSKSMTGVVTVEERMVILLDVDHLLESDVVSASATDEDEDEDDE